MEVVKLKGVVLVLVLVLVVIVSGDQATPPPYSSTADGAMRQLMKAGVSLPQLYLPWLVSSNSSCHQALLDMAVNIIASNSWSARMVDSWGKSKDGYFFGVGGNLGMYDECVTTTSTSNGFKGKFCSIHAGKIVPEDDGYTPRAENALKLNMTLPTHYKLKELRDVQPRMGPSTIINRGANLVLNYATCMPSVCTKKELEESLFWTTVLHGYWSYVEACHTEKSEVPFDAAVISFICVCVILLTLLVVASLLDLYIIYSGKTQLTKGYLKYLLVFSAYTNASKIFQINNDSPPSTISCLHGIRVLSMTWVISCHQETTPYFATANLVAVFTYKNHIMSGLLYQVFANGFPSVDSFFFMSGLLLSYSVLRELKRTRRFNYPIYILHRYIRLVPPILLVGGMAATLMRYFLSGVHSNYWDGWENSCRHFWWKDALLINNISLEMCLGQTWYLSADTQMYFVAPLILLPLFFYKRAGKIWLYVTTVVSILIPTIIIMINDLPPTALIYDEKTMQYYDKIYFESWCRASPWMIGIWLGYILVKQGNTRPKMSGIVVTIGWTLATLTGLLVVFGMWSYNILPDGDHYIKWDTMTQLVYGGLHRPAWAAALSWMVYACHYGYGGLVNSFLSHPAWQPLSRLTYSMYLVIYPLQFAIDYCTRIPFYYTHFNKVMETVGAIFVAFPITVLVSLMAEAPIIGLEKLLLRPAPRRPKPTEAEPMKPATSNTKHDEPGDMTEAEKSLSSYMMEDLKSHQPAHGHDNPALILEEGLVQRHMNGGNIAHQ